ncbi:CPBP family intramembrane glutamic endopeptidase [Nocardiopsis sp. MG754419]|uniref:CPBP family intramembrane glutamic endopeptidase n=1 Tax=Nocardiopsis sp. MG754419 TaxID=2259865 RepID=UPI0027DE65EB|nr:CPBP family intramembrane glutamic endopeptidase [Nocardiopsis sp. MG754419]MBR8740766.1 CPBP family intramembrane metalloprotease domain-containing protein [Nocardiopsis sp. MG754419]
MLAGRERGIGRGLLAILLLLDGLVVFSHTLSQAAGVIDLRAGRVNPAMDGTDYTPLYHGATMFALALLVPWSMVVQRWLYGVPGASLHSVFSRFRFDVLGRSLLYLGPVWPGATVVLNVAMPTGRIHWSFVDLVLLVALTLLPTPLQATGEEYGLRGLLFRFVGSRGRGSRTSLVLAVLVSSLVFTLIHGAADPWINLWYFTLASSLAVITWRTGGIEIAVLLHALLNPVTFLPAIAVHSDIGTLVTDRSAGTGSAALLVPSVTAIAITAMVWWRTRRTGPTTTPAGSGSAIGGEASVVRP